MNDAMHSTDPRNAARATNVSASDLTNVLEARSRLIKIAAQLARGDGFPSPFLDDHSFPKMSRAGRLFVADQLGKVDDRHKELAIELRKIADSLTSNAPLTGAATGGKDEHR